MKRDPKALLALMALALATVCVAEDRAPSGAKIYQANCQSCHGRNGKATPFYAKKGVPDLNDAEWQKERTDDFIRNVISEGSEGTVMKAFKKILTPEQIDEVVKHVRTLTAAP